MHHYPFHPGDYMLDTAHLEPLEDLAYRRLLDLYYSSETPIPAETGPVSRRLRLHMDLVNRVLSEFFEESAEGWRHARCDAEISEYQRLASVRKANGSLGGRPKKTKTKPRANLAASGQQPASSNQEPEPRTNKGTCTLDEAKAFAVEIGMPASDGESCFHKWTGNGWMNGQNRVKDWKATIRSWQAAGYLPSQKNGKPGGFNGLRMPKHAAYNADTATLGLTAEQIGTF